MIIWIILLRAVWVLLLIVCGLMTLMMFAFADSPDAGKAAQNMIAPALIYALAVFAVSGWLLMHGAWWSVALAFVLPLTPPLAIFAGYRFLRK